MPIPIESIKSHFPIFTHRPELVYLDSAATSQKPQTVIDTLTRFYESENANIQRGLYELSATATKRYEAVRHQIASLIGAGNPNSMAFTKGATESINIIASGYLKKKLQAGDNVVISAMEHHANLIPWQQVCKQEQATLRVIPVTSSGELDLQQLSSLLDARTKLVAVTHISNVLGTINPIDEIIDTAHRKNIPVLIDAAQSAGHHPIDVTQSNIDFLAFSAHKMFGPMGTGVLYSSEPFHSEIDPFIFGGGNITNVEFEHTEFMDYPHKLEAGTAHVPGVIGLGSALDFIESLDMASTVIHEQDLTGYFRERLTTLGGFNLVGRPAKSAGIVSFTSEKIHPHDVASFLAHAGIAVRAGNHCCQPLLDSMGVPATVRVSFSVYNNREDVDRTLEALADLKKFWA